MGQLIKNIFTLSGKEVRSFVSDKTLLRLVVMMFTVAIYIIASGITTEVKNANIGIVDYDRSALTYQIRDAMLPPEFKQVDDIAERDIDKLMDRGAYTFALSIPPQFTADLLAGKRPELQLLIDATAMTQAGAGARYIAQIVNRQITDYLGKQHPDIALITPKINILFNENLHTERFLPAMQVGAFATLLCFILVGGAVIREREHGTIEHLLVMPVTALEIVLAKVIANSMIILIASFVSIYFVVHLLVGAPIHGSLALYLLVEALYLLSISSMAILLATIAPTMPQFSLLCIPIYVMLYVLSGSLTPFENQPVLLQYIMQFSPLRQFTSISQDILFRGASWQMVAPRVAMIALLGLGFMVVALLRFRSMLARQN